MIIGSNNSFNNENRNFQTKWNNVNEQSQKKHPNKNIFVKDITEHKYANPSNREAMYDKSLAMLQSRLDNNLISTEEFNKKCAQLNRSQENMRKKNKLF